MLELRSISKRIGTLDLADVTLTIAAGEYFVLLGPSGVGKTVLLEIIAGLIPPDSGTILRRGVDITRASPEARGFAVVYQDYALFPHLTVARNIAYALRARGAEAGQIARRVETLADMLQIRQLLDRRPDTLSGGEKQRVALARALAPEGELLLLDEPLSAVDVNTRLQLRKQLKRINRELNVAILHVTHDPQEAMALGDRVGVMLDNRIRQVAPPEELFRRPSDPNVAEFLGMWNVLPVTRAEDGLCRVDGADVHVSSAGVDVSHIWIKPEEILLSRGPFDSSARNQFRCKVVEWSHRDPLLAVQVAVGDLLLTALITHASFQELRIERGLEIYATFKSSAVHCF